LYKKEDKPAFKTIEAYRQAVLKDEREIQVKDFGAGSKVFKSDTRKVADIAKNAGISRKRAILLNKITSYFKVKSAIELGTSVGISSAAMAAGNDLKLLTIEGCPETAKIAGEYFKRFKLENIQLVTGSFEEKTPQAHRPPKGELSFQIPKYKIQLIDNPQQAPQPPKGELKVQIPNSKIQSTDNPQQAPQPPKGELSFQIPKYKIQSTHNRQLTTDNSQPTTQNPQPKTDNLLSPTHNPQPKTDFVYFDGNHQKEPTLKYFLDLLPLAHNNSVFIFDDIHWSSGMEEAWEEIKIHPRVRVTIDTFYWGIVFFREEQEKEHFTIRL